MGNLKLSHILSGFAGVLFTCFAYKSLTSGFSFETINILAGGILLIFLADLNEIEEQ